MTFETAFNQLKKFEGGYQNIKSDNGNKNSNGEFVGTNYGISAKAYEDYYGEIPSIDDMMSLTIEDAKQIYKQNYWDLPNIQQFPDGTRYLFFDVAVNSGVPSMRVMVSKLGINATPEQIKQYRDNLYSSINNPEWVDGWLKRSQESYDFVISQVKKNPKMLLLVFFLSLFF